MIEKKLPKMEMEDDIPDPDFHFPEEMLLEILVKLPLKSVFRFRCACKNWLSLISDASFFRCLVSRSKDSPPFTLIFQCDNYIGNMGIHGFLSTGNCFKNFSPSFLSDQIPCPKVEATSNDLILYQSNCHESEYFVANLFTKQRVIIPMYGRRRSYGHAGLISSVSNGITSYSIVRLTEDHDSAFSDAKLCLNLEMFSSEKGEWRDFEPRNCILDVEFDARPRIVFKGVLHWICNKMTILLAYYKDGMNAILGVSGENLYYLEMSRVSIQGCNFHGWKLRVLKDYESGGWIRRQKR